MEEETKSELPTQIDESDALRLENMELQMQLLNERVQKEFDKLKAKHEAFQSELAKKYQCDPTKDRIDFTARTITRG